MLPATNLESRVRFVKVLRWISVALFACMNKYYVLGGIASIPKENIFDMTSTDQTSEQLPPSKYLCLTILGFRKPGMSEEAYRRHMIEVSAPLTKDLMAKYGVKRWTVIHNSTETKNLMTHLYDRQMSNIADYDCFSQVVFESLEHYKKMKDDPWYKQKLFGDHENFADTKRSVYVFYIKALSSLTELTALTKYRMTIGWIEEWLNDGEIRESMNAPWPSFKV